MSHYAMLLLLLMLLQTLADLLILGLLFIYRVFA